MQKLSRRLYQALYKHHTSGGLYFGPDQIGFIKEHNGLLGDNIKIIIDSFSTDLLDHTYGHGMDQ